MGHKDKPGQLVVTNAKASEICAVTKKGAVCKIQSIERRSSTLEYTVTLVALLPNNQWTPYEVTKFPIYQKTQSRAFISECALDPYSPTILTSRRTNAN